MRSCSEPHHHPHGIRGWQRHLTCVSAFLIKVCIAVQSANSNRSRHRRVKASFKKDRSDACDGDSNTPPWLPVSCSSCLSATLTQPSVSDIIVKITFQVIIWAHVSDFLVYSIYRCTRVCVCVCLSDNLKCLFCICYVYLYGLSFPTDFLYILLFCTAFWYLHYCLHYSHIQYEYD